LSLLLDALKRAEQEKLARGERPELQVVSSPDSAQATPAATPAPRASAAATQGAPKSSLELQPVVPGPGAPPPASSPAAAQAVFQAKLPAGRSEGKSRRGWVFAAAGVLALAVIAAGGYVWYALQALAPAPVPARRMAGPLAPPPPAASAMPALPAAPEKGSLPAAVAETVSKPTPAPVAAAPKAPPAASSSEATAAELLRESPPRSEPPLRAGTRPGGAPHSS
jgi:hypothetical protein